MIRVDVLVVGGGPAGSTCARLLREAGYHVLVADRARFPRDKVCAGWLTPPVFRALDLRPDEYRDTGLTLQEISGFNLGVIGGAMAETAYPGVVSYAIRRREFDHFLLQRARVPVLEHTPIDTLRRGATTWMVNGHIETPLVIGAGGHFCPVARHLRGGADMVAPIVAKEAEFPIAEYAPGAAGRAPTLYFCRDLEGYGWCVPKGDYVNVGIGRRVRDDFARHVRGFTALLEASGVHAGNAAIHWRGHAYLAAGAGARPLAGPGVLLIGDAAGLAYPESGEGIRPAIESARLAAHAVIAARGRYDDGGLQPYADRIRALYPPAPARRAGVSAASAMAGRWLMRSAAFRRRVVLDRWFLRTGGVESRERVALAAAS